MCNTGTCCDLGKAKCVRYAHHHASHAQIMFALQPVQATGPEARSQHEFAIRSWSEATNPGMSTSCRTKHKAHGQKAGERCSLLDHAIVETRGTVSSTVSDIVGDLPRSKKHKMEI